MLLDDMLDHHIPKASIALLRFSAAVFSLLRSSFTDSARSLPFFLKARPHE
jgi:hypothetical protein